MAYMGAEYKSKQIFTKINGDRLWGKLKQNANFLQGYMDRQTLLNRLRELC